MPKILVIGDLMIDHYIWGNCSRISPEAPVQVVLEERESKRLGGCGNVISNLIALGSEVSVISVLGDDNLGREISSLLADIGVKEGLLLKERGRKSSQKTRIMAAHQQVLRLDRESIQDISLASEILAKASSIIAEHDIVLLSDYGKGVLTHELTTGIIKLAKEQNKMVLVDPKGEDYSKYKGASLLTPNRKEASQALNIAINDDESVKIAAKELKSRFDLDFGLITLSEQGIGLFDGNEFSSFPALAKEVFDVTGAGDSVLATLGYCLARGDDIKTAIKYANLAAAVVVGKVGSADASWDEIHALLNENQSKILSLDALEKILAKKRAKGAKIIFTNGCFDILHTGHISYLQKAKALGDILIVGLNSDESVRRLKGNSRPVNCQDDRALMLEALACVDFIVLFSEDTPENLIKNIKPDILVKGADYEGKEVVGAKHAGCVRLIDFIKGKSTSNIIQKIKDFS